MVNLPSYPVSLARASRCVAVRARLAAQVRQAGATVCAGITVPEQVQNIAITIHYLLRINRICNTIQSH